MVKNEFARQFTITFLLIIIYRLGLHVSIPFVNEKALIDCSDGYGPEKISIFALGIMPYISAYLLVEICSLFIPFLKKLRKGDYNSRCTLKAYAFVITLFFGAFQGNGIIKVLEVMTSPNGTRILNTQGVFDYVIILASLIGGVFFLLFIAEQISKYGIGNGISILILSGFSAQYSPSFVGEIKSFFFNEAGFFIVLLLLVLFFTVAFAIIILLRTKIGISTRHKLLDKPVNFFQLNTCPSGTLAIFYTSSLLMLPVTFFDLFCPGVEILSAGSFLYNSLNVVFICLLSFLLAWLFFHPKRRFEKMRDQGWEFFEDNQNAVNTLSRRVLILNLPWTALLSIVAILPSIMIYSFSAPFYIGVLSLFPSIAIILDIVDRLNVLRKSKSGKLFKIAELHDPYDATMIKQHLKSEGITCHLQGYYHRHLLFFFGPYIDISLMVPESDKESGREIISRYYNSLGLLNEIKGDVGSKTT